SSEVCASDITVEEIDEIEQSFEDEIPEDIKEVLEDRKQELSAEPKNLSQYPELRWKKTDIKEVMKESNAVFGGEHSGHYYFRDNYRADSGMLAMLVLLQVVSEAGVPLSEIRRQYEPYAPSGEINFDVADKQAAIEAVSLAYEHANQDRLDGLTVDFGESWFNLRPSNTEPVLRLNAEAPTAGDVAELVAQVSKIFLEEA
ncbi:MAG: hypothetical protein IIB04_04145, partial [Acidobacteria bacterium]|nr:hypothetical protein [Acidobacteriota bacterium]